MGAGANLILMRLRLFAALPMVLVLLSLAAPASAHARYESSNPADGSSVARPPGEVQADFSEPVTSDSYMEITDPCGQVVSGDSRPVADKVNVSMSGSRSGTYRVYYRVQSSVDSHVTDGTFTFTSSGGDPCPGEEPPGGGGTGGDDPSDPGNGGSDDSGSGGGGDSPSDGGDAPVDTASETSSDEPAADGAGDQNHAKHRDGDKKQGGKERGARNVELSLQSEARERKGPDPWDLPRGGLIAGLVIAALIGAAGGRIYASIIGPRD